MRQRIVVPLNGRASGEKAADHAAALARAAGAELHLVVVDGRTHPDPTSEEFLQGNFSEYREQNLRPLADRIRREFGIPVVTALLMGPIVAGLVNYIETTNATLIVMSTHGRTGLGRAWLGSVADDLLHAIPIPAILLRMSEDGQVASGLFPRILVALDGTPRAERALRLAARIARVSKSTLVLARVVTPIVMTVAAGAIPGVTIIDHVATQSLVEDTHAYLEGLAEPLRARDALTVEIVVEYSSGTGTLPTVGAVVARLARDTRADLVALTSHDRRSSRLLVASVADKVLEDTGAALLLCHEILVERKEGLSVRQFSREVVL